MVRVTQGYGLLGERVGLARVGAVVGSRSFGSSSVGSH